MLIRSQDRTVLLNMNSMGALVVDDQFRNECKIFERGNGIGREIGSYSTKEKAIQVLDMIEERYNEPVYLNEICNHEYAKYEPETFHMPQDNEV